MTGKQVRNIWGQALTRDGRIDQRAMNAGRPKAGPPMFFVRHMPNDVKPWHVMRRSAEGEAVTRISRHFQEERAREKTRQANDAR